MGTKIKTYVFGLGLKKNLNYFWCECSSICQNGAPLLQVVEHARLTISRGYLFRSYKTKTDFTALAKMKWIDGCSTKLLAQTFEVTEATIDGYLRKLKKDGALQRLKLSKNETAKINESILGEAPYGKIG